MKTTVKAFALVLFSLPLIASAAGKVATSAMQVSFVVKESCTVQSTTASAAKTPAVACQLNTPYQLTRGADKAAATSSSDTSMAIRTETAAQDWTITF
jgi:hypothetical protein